MNKLKLNQETAVSTIEFDLLITILNGNDIILKNSLMEMVNWNEFLRLAFYHKVYPLVYKRLSQQSFNHIPEFVREELQQLFLLNTMRMLNLVKEIEQVTLLFMQHNISSIILKGPLLSQELYGDISSRTSNDIDLLIELNDLDEVTRLLISVGYKIKYQPPRLLEDWKVRNHHVEFFHEEKNCEIEVHWRLHPGPSKEPSFAELWEGKEKSTITNTPIYHLGKEHLLYYLLTHGSRHGWFRIRWITDVLCLINKTINFEREWAILQENKSVVQYYQFICLVEKLGLTYSNSITILPGRKAKRLAEKAYMFIKEGINIDHPPTKKWEIFANRYLFQVKPFSQQCQFLIRKLYANSWDAEALPLPRYLHFLYLPLRPMIWVWKQLLRQKVIYRRF
ncbi:nucleotidyltransferase family protein [Niallia taxi]|uniref:nucleotidyltransferase domain-containing protein n=1 Tax=Niallia taxi TaxID=2499688 RepID=UPI00398274CC